MNLPWLDTTGGARVAHRMALDHAGKITKLALHRSLYVAFGAPNIGAWIEIGAILAAIVLVFLVRGQLRAFRLTLIGAVSV